MISRLWAGTAALVISAALSGAAFAHHQPGHQLPPGQDRTCLATFGSPAEAEAGANTDVVRAKHLPRKAADKQASKDPNSATFDYPTNERATCESLNPGGALNP